MGRHLRDPYAFRLRRVARDPVRPDAPAVSVPDKGQWAMNAPSPARQKRPSSGFGDPSTGALSCPPDDFREKVMNRYWLTGVAFAAGLGLASAQAQVKVGMAGPITGPSAATGAQMKNGVEQAVEDINAAGGILGQKLTVSIGDDVSDPKQGVSVANKFVGDGIKFVVGDYNSGVSIPASEVYNENGILQITPASTNPNFTERKLWNTFRTCGRDDQQGA